MKRFLFATIVLCAIGHCAFGADTDGDGLLDVLDAPGFDANASDVDLNRRGIQDLDGANLLANATRLELWGNQITSLENGDFQGLSNLRVLGLSRNQITSLGDRAFQGLSNLQELNLDGNQITSLGSGAFQGLNNLQRLYLGFNPIKRLNLKGATLDAVEALTGSFEDLILDEALLSRDSFENITFDRPLSSISLVGMGFSDSYPTNLSQLLSLQKLDNVRVDQALFDRYAAEFIAFDELPGNTVIVVPEPSALFLFSAACVLAGLFHHQRRGGRSSVHNLPGLLSD